MPQANVMLMDDAEIENGYVHGTNRIIGAALLSQTRREIAGCNEYTPPFYQRCAADEFGENAGDIHQTEWKSWRGSSGSLTEKSKMASTKHSACSRDECCLRSRQVVQPAWTHRLAVAEDGVGLRKTSSKGLAVWFSL